MKLKEGFIQRTVAGEHIMIPVGAENISNYNGVITLNASAAYICSLLKEDHTKESLVQALLEKFEVDQARASEDIDQLLALMGERHMLED